MLHIKLRNRGPVSARCNKKVLKEVLRSDKSMEKEKWEMRCNRTLAVIATAAIVLSLTGLACKNSFLFYPYKPLVADPSSIGLQYEDINFKTEDGINLNGWWVPAKWAKGTVLFCHGNGGNISFLLDTIRIFHSLDLNV